MSLQKEGALALSLSNQVNVLNNGTERVHGRQDSDEGIAEDEKDVQQGEDDTSSTGMYKEGQIPMKYRIMAFAFVLFFSTGAAFAEVTMGPLKSTLQRELNLNSEYMSA
jgi:hypothetical protein